MIVRVIVLFVFLTAPFFCTESVAAAPQILGKVLRSAPGLSINKRPLKSGDVITEDGVLSVGERGPAEIQLQDGVRVIVAAKSAIQLHSPGVLAENSLVSGQARWIVNGGPSPKVRFKVRTPSAVMGVRGTDFLTIFTPLFQESELVVFDGTVEFSSPDETTERKLVPKGHWGGRGGRFGKRIGDLIELPANILDALQTPVH